MNAAVWVVAVGFALMGGVYFAFSGFVMGSLQALPSATGIAAMQSINRVILSSAFMPLFWATSLAALGLAAWGGSHWSAPGSSLLVAGGLLYVVGMFVCTAAFNVPLNNALDAVDSTSSAGAAVWAKYLVEWTRWNHVRTAACLAAAGLLLAAARSAAA